MTFEIHFSTKTGPQVAVDINKDTVVSFVLVSKVLTFLPYVTFTGLGDLE